jgi:integrase
VKDMPWYRTEGKIQTPLSDQDFLEGMQTGKFLQAKHRGYTTLLYYSAVRKTEGLRATKEQFTFDKKSIIFSVGKRLKHGIETPSLRIPIVAPFADTIIDAIEHTSKQQRVFPYSPKTGYNIVHRAFKYPHLFRLSRITNFFLEGWTIAQVHSWTGLTLKALDYYTGLVDIQKMGDSLK